MTRRLKELGVEICLDTHITKIIPKGTGFQIHAGSKTCQSQKKICNADRVILACGGKAAPVQGSDGTDSEDSDGSQEPIRSRSEGQNTGSSSLQASRDSGEIQGEKDSGKKIQKAEGSRSDAPDTLPEPTVHDPSPYVLTPAQPHRVDGLIVNSAVYYNLSERIFFDRSNSGREPFDLFSDDTVLPAQDCFQISSTAAYYQKTVLRR